MEKTARLAKAKIYKQLPSSPLEDMQDHDEYMSSDEGETKFSRDNSKELISTSGSSSEKDIGEAENETQHVEQTRCQVFQPTYPKSTHTNPTHPKSTRIQTLLCLGCVGFWDGFAESRVRDDQGD